MQVDPVRLAKLNKDIQELKRREEKERCEESLSEFVKGAWPFIDTAEYKSCFAIDAMCDHLEAVTSGHIKRLLINVPPRSGKTSVVSIAYPVWTWARSVESYLSGPKVKFLCASYNHSLSLENSTKSRRLILSPWYQERWGDRFKLSLDQNSKQQYDNTSGGSRIATSVGGSLLGIGGSVLIGDDLHNTETVESEAERQTVLNFWNEFHSTRLNDPKQSAVIVVMQRLHQSDVSGVILDSNEDWTHLMLPMRFDESRRCVTVRLPQYDDDEPWTDPRTIDGELLWPDRFGEKEVRALETALGPYMCTPKESPVLMSDLSIKPISDVQIGDEVVGFNVITGREDNPNAEYRRRKLRRSKVVGKTSIVAKVVKITLDSGNVIRCTPEHRWYVGKQGGRRGHHKDGSDDIRPLYREAIVGRALMRVCPPFLPTLTYEEQRMAGWLSGFYDGEGSSSSVQGCENGRFSSQIKYHQGTGRNKPLCDLLEKYLTYFGFTFSFSDHIRSDRRVNLLDTHRNRVYRLYRPNGALHLIQRFLHIVQPTKWRDRLIEAAYGAKWISGQERVVSIEPDGEETVYALETETGNYIVWGLASSNSSGRLQQMPSPKGGGILKREWWQSWDTVEAAKYGLEWNEARGGRKEFPDFDLIVGSLDTAYKEKEENDYSALTLWGTFIDRNKNRRAMLIYAWAKRLPLHGSEVERRSGEPAVTWKQRQQEEMGLVELVAQDCKKFKVNRLLIEDKARGIDVANELKRLYARENWGIQLVQISQDKVARAHATVPLFADKAIFAPILEGLFMDWAEKVVVNAELFPKVDHDDLTDSTTMAINWFRINGLLLMRDEMSGLLEDAAAYQPQTESVSSHYGV